jgi:hypothetical protein
MKYVLQETLNIIKEKLKLIDLTDPEYRFLAGLKNLKAEDIKSTRKEFINNIDKIVDLAKNVSENYEGLILNTFSNAQHLEDKPNLVNLFKKDLMYLVVLFSDNCQFLNDKHTIQITKLTKFKSFFSSKVGNNKTIGQMKDIINKNYTELIKLNETVKIYDNCTLLINGYDTLVKTDPKMKLAYQFKALTECDLVKFKEILKDETMAKAFREFLIDSLNKQGITNSYFPIFVLDEKSEIIKKVKLFINSLKEQSGGGIFKALKQKAAEKYQKTRSGIADYTKRSERAKDEDSKLVIPDGLTDIIKDDDLRNSIARIVKHGGKDIELGDGPSKVKQTYNDILKFNGTVEDFFVNEDLIKSKNSTPAITHLKSSAKRLGGNISTKPPYIITSDSSSSSKSPNSSDSPDVMTEERKQEAHALVKEALSSSDEGLPSQEMLAKSEAANKETQKLTTKLAEQLKDIKITPTELTIKQTPAATCNQSGPLAKLIPKANILTKAKAVNKSLDKFESFVNFIINKNANWSGDSTKTCGDITVAINAATEDINKATSRGAKQNAISRLYLFNKKMLKMYGDKTNVNWQLNKTFFLKSDKQTYKNIMNFLALNGAKFTPEEKTAYNSIKTRYTTLFNKLDTSNQQYYKALKISFSNCNKVGKNNSNLTKDQKDELETKGDIILHMMDDNIAKLKSLYNLNHSSMDLIDSQFFVLYVIKGIRILFTYIALFLTTRVFSPIYEEQVYDKKGQPPSLAKYLLIFLAFDISFNVFLVVVLFLLKFLFKSDDNAFIIDNYVFSKYFTDYIISLVLVLAIGYMIGRVIMEKKYFKYRYEGLRAIRAFESTLFNMAIVVYLVPYFWMI